MIHLGRNTWRELEKRVIRSLKVVYSKTENKGDYSFIHSITHTLECSANSVSIILKLLNHIVTDIYKTFFLFEI